VGGDHVTTAEHNPASLFFVIVDSPVITGPPSFTITSKPQVFVFPAASWAVYRTCVVPNGNVAPGLKFDVNEFNVQSSLAVGGVQFTTALHKPGSVFTVIVEGQPEIVGLVTSFSLMLNEH
jgi:hypothetical protein